jgi:hypothetical protein
MPLSLSYFLSGSLLYLVLFRLIFFPPQSERVTPALMVQYSTLVTLSIHIVLSHYGSYFVEQVIFLVVTFIKHVLSDQFS